MPASRRTTTDEPKSLSEVLHTRATPTSARKARSFNLPIEVVRRASNTMVGVQALSYKTRLHGQVPESLTRFVEDAIEAACTFWENELNDGQPFDEASLTPGPGPAGAREGAEKRRQAADAKRRSEPELADEILEATATGRRSPAGSSS